MKFQSIGLLQGNTTVSMCEYHQLCIYPTVSSNVASCTLDDVFSIMS